MIALCVRERGFAVGIEVRIGFIEDDEEGISIEGAGQRDALLLSGREKAIRSPRFRVS